MGVGVGVGVGVDVCVKQVYCWIERIAYMMLVWPQLDNRFATSIITVVLPVPAAAVTLTI